MEQFIVAQMVVVKEEFIAMANNVKMDCILRNVFAETKEEAIGKFVVNTQKIEVSKRLNIECINIKELSRID